MFASAGVPGRNAIPLDWTDLTMPPRIREFVFCSLLCFCVPSQSESREPFRFTRASRDTEIQEPSQAPTAAAATPPAAAVRRRRPAPPPQPIPDPVIVDEVLDYSGPGKGAAPAPSPAPVPSPFPRVYLFSASWCAPCVRMRNDIQRWQQNDPTLRLSMTPDNPQAVIWYIDTDTPRGRQLMQQVGGISAIPSVVIVQENGTHSAPEVYQSVERVKLLRASQNPRGR